MNSCCSQYLSREKGWNQRNDCLQATKRWHSQDYRNCFRTYSRISWLPCSRNSRYIGSMQGCWRPFQPICKILKKSPKKTHFDIYDFTVGFYTWQNMCRRKPRGWFRQHPSKWWWRSQYRNLHSTWVSNYAFWWQHHNWSHSGHSRRCGWFGPRQQVRCRFINLQKSWNLETLFILKTFTQKSLQFALWITLNFVIR